MNQLLMQRRVNSQTRGDDVSGPENISTERSGQWVIYLTTDNVVKVEDIRNGSFQAQLIAGVESRGVCFNREADKFIVGQNIAGVWYVSEYNFPAMTFIRQWNLNTLGSVTSLNTVRYTVNNRYILVGHSTGSFVLNTQTGLIQPIDEPLTGDVEQFECLSSMYAIAMRSDLDVKLCQINTGRDMLYIGDLVWDELSTFCWNWEVDEVTPYPHFIMGLRQGSQWHLAPFKLGNFDFYDSQQWDIVLDQKPLAIAFSETDNSSSVTKESTFGRAFVVFFPDRYDVYDLLTGEFKASFTTTQQVPITCGYWKEAQGLYL